MVFHGPLLYKVHLKELSVLVNIHYKSVAQPMPPMTLQVNNANNPSVKTICFLGVHVGGGGAKNKGEIRIFSILEEHQWERSPPSVLVLKFTRTVEKTLQKKQEVFSVENLGSWLNHLTLPCICNQSPLIPPAVILLYLILNWLL